MIYNSEKELEGSFMLLYDVISTKVYWFKTQFWKQKVICSSNNKLFTVSNDEEGTKVCLSFSVYEVVLSNVKLGARKIVEGSQQTFFNNIHLLFSLCVGDKLYVFYYGETNETNSLELDITDDFYLLIFCVKTLSVVQSEKIVIKNINHDSALVSRKEIKQKVIHWK